jgi:hypothetical protein
MTATMGPASTTAFTPNDPESLRRASYVAAQAADMRVNVELETNGMTVNLGPQHPATHGTLRIVA